MVDDPRTFAVDLREKLYVERAMRRSGVGRQALAWLTAHAWPAAARLRVEVLTATPEATAFWRAVGFADYCLTLERELPRAP